MSSSLDRWFTSKSAEVPTYFYQDWRQFSAAIWLNELNPNKHPVNFQRRVIWPEMRKEIVVCGYLPEPAVRIPAEEKYQNVGMMKSHLQKCLRRQATDLAVKSAYHLLKMEPAALFRRLTVIVLEDVFLLEGYGTLVWLSLATQSLYLVNKPEQATAEKLVKASDKEPDRATAETTVKESLQTPSVKFYWSMPIIQWLLTFVHYLSEFNYFDNLSPPARSRFNFENNLDKIQKQIEPRAQALIYAMKLRRDLIESIPGEQRLQDQKIHLWYLRFSQAPKYQKYIDLVFGSSDSRLIQVPERMKLREWLLPGIDFHCSPMLIDWTVQKYPDLTPTEIREAIWAFRSSLNKRSYLGPKPTANPESERVWRKIQISVENSCMYILKHYH